jgi:hypothetical protein
MPKMTTLSKNMAVRLANSQNLPNPSPLKCRQKSFVLRRSLAVRLVTSALLYTVENDKRMNVKCEEAKNINLKQVKLTIASPYRWRGMPGA